MELNITELDSVNTMNPYDTTNYNNNYNPNVDNYWAKQEVNQPKKKKVSFNDILSNMNLVVNNQGVLQFMAPNPVVEQNEYEYRPNYGQSYDPNILSYQQQQQQPSYQIKKIGHQSQQQIDKNVKSEPIDPAVKHSYIYNKYFKDYNDPNIQDPGPRVPKTMEEYRQMLLDDHIKAIQHKQRVEQIKSKKMMFTSAPGAQMNPRNMRATSNNLRSMSFR